MGLEGVGLEVLRVRRGVRLGEVMRGQKDRDPRRWGVGLEGDIPGGEGGGDIPGGGGGGGDIPEGGWALRLINGGGGGTEIPRESEGLRS